MFADAPTVGEAGPGWLSVLIQTGSFGLIAYLIVRGLPALQKEIMVERKEERGEFMKAIDSLTTDRRAERVDFANTVKVITDYSRSEMEAIRTSARQEVEALRQTFQQETRETRAVQMEMVNAMRTAVHDVRDVAGVTMNRATAALQQQVKGAAS